MCVCVCVGYNATFCRNLRRPLLGISAEASPVPDRPPPASAAAVVAGVAAASAGFPHWIPSTTCNQDSPTIISLFFFLLLFFLFKLCIFFFFFLKLERKSECVYFCLLAVMVDPVFRPAELIRPGHPGRPETLIYPHSHNFFLPTPSI